MSGLLTHITFHLCSAQNTLLNKKLGKWLLAALLIAQQNLHLEPGEIA